LPAKIIYLKAAFNILPEGNDNGSLHLLTEVGEDGISFVWFSKAPVEIKGLVIYNFTDGLTYAEIAAEIDSIFKSNALFNDWYASVSICYGFKESLLIPKAYNAATVIEPMLNLMYDSGNREDIKTETIEGTGILNAYAVDKKITSVLLTKFPNATCYHSNSLLLQRIRSQVQYLYCIIFHNSLKVFLFKDGALQLSQQFHYSKPVDVSYHLLNCCEQYQVNSSEMQLQLSGMIDAHSNLYNELYKYFLNIGFEPQQAGIISNDRIKFYPGHFFSHLTSLVSCVS
jgi:Protein of unknown function (DUF3822)